MKNQTLFSLKDKSKKLKCRLLQFLLGALRVNSFASNVYDRYCCLNYRIYPAIRRGFCPSRMTSNN